MSFFNSPVFMCFLIALGIVLVLVVVIVICCKRNSSKEREELRAISHEIENDLCEESVSTVEDSKIENVLSKMQEALESGEDSTISFEQQQEENAIISYQELLASLGTKSSIDVDSIQVFDDELDSQIEISDFNKEIIDAYQNESFDNEVYMFQNDYSSQEMPMEFPKEDVPVMNFDFSDDSIVSDDSLDVVSFDEAPVYEAKHVVGNHKFKKTEFISPIYGIIDNEPKVDDVEKLDFDDNDSLLDDF